MGNPLGVDTTFFTFLGYPMSYIEFVGTILYLLSVWLIAKRNILTWPVGMASVLLYMALFYQIRLYSDALEQVYYLGASAYGWWHWSHSWQVDHIIADVAYSSRRAMVAWVAVIAVLSVALGALMSHAHLLAPALFPEAASYPFLDAFTTIMSLVAMWLMARRRIESWIYRIIVDVIGISLYYAKDIKFESLLYVFLLVLAAKGFLDWRKAAGKPAISGG